MEELLNQITELKAENEALAELVRLKEAFDPSEYHKDLIRGYKAQRLELQAEIKQLLAVVERTRQYCESGNGCGGATKLPSGEWHNEGEGTLYHAVLAALSPAIVTLPKLIQSNALPPNHFTGMGDDGKPFIGEISTGIMPKNEDQQ